MFNRQDKPEPIQPSRLVDHRRLNETAEYMDNAIHAPFFRLWRTTNLATATGYVPGGRIVPWQTGRVAPGDDLARYWNPIDSARIILPIGGLWLISHCVTWDANGSGARDTRIEQLEPSGQFVDRISSNSVISLSSNGHDSSNLGSTSNGTVLLSLRAGTNFKIGAYHNSSTSPLNVIAGETNTFIQATWMGE